LSDSVLTIETFIEPMFGENAYVIGAADGEGSMVGWVIDPSFPPQVDQLLTYISEQGIKVEKIILTHGHADHIAGVDRVHDAYPQAEVWIGREDELMLSDGEKNLSGNFGMGFALEARPDSDLAPGTELTLGQTCWRVLDTSGHSPGGRSLYCAEAGAVFVGDALFSGSIGRTDFPDSDHHQFISNILKNLMTLPDETAVYSGHGPVTFIGIEHKSNPFLSDA